VKLNRLGAAVSLLAAGSLVLSACGSDKNTSSGGSSSAASGASTSKIDCGGKKTLKSSGSSAQANAMTQFVNAFEQACSGFTLNYTSNGSGAGVKEFIGKQTDFGGSDSPLDATKGEVDQAKQRCGSDAWNLPVVFGPIAVTYNVPGVDALALDGPTAAKIFNGAITTWNDPAVAALNPGVSLPGDPIHVVFRSDESGTTDNFQKYLDSASNGAWGKGAGKVFNGGVGEGAKGNEGTSAAIKGTAGSITYNEWSFAKSQNLQMAKIVTSAGPDAVAISRARHDVVLQADPGGFLPDCVGYLRDRLLEVPRRRHRQGGQGLPAVRGRPGPEWARRPRLHPGACGLPVEAIHGDQRHRMILSS
jgi:phosphate transport system substrate-binding protein